MKPCRELADTASLDNNLKEWCLGGEEMEQAS